MKISEIKRGLKEISKEELVNDISDLIKKSDFVRDYYLTKFSDENGFSVLTRYKDAIRDEFFPKYGDGLGRLSVAKKAISEFKKISSNNEHVAEIMIYYVEVGVEYTDAYGDINEQFYISMESMYERAINHIVKSDLEEKFRDRCQKIVDDTVDMGWGFHDQLCEIFYGNFG